MLVGRLLHPDIALWPLYLPSCGPWCIITSKITQPRPVPNTDKMDAAEDTTQRSAHYILHDDCMLHCMTA